MIADLKGSTPVALSSDLARGCVLRTKVEDRDIVVWRSQSNRVRAWENRCPHRGMRLSFGFVRGDSLTCIYHGWQYDTDGVCRYIPAHPDLKPPKTLCVTAYNCVEKSGLILVSLSRAEGEPRLDIEHADPVRSLTIEREPAAVSRTLSCGGFPIAEAWSPGEGEYDTVENFGSVIVYTGCFNHHQRRLIVALQTLPGQRTTIHLLTSPIASPDLKKALSRWLECRRRFAETPDSNTALSQPGGQAIGT